LEVIGKHGYINWLKLQKGNLPNTKKLFEDYLDIHSQVLQDCILRVDKTFERYAKGDCNGKRSGKPRFKKCNRYRSFTFPQMKPTCLDSRYIDLPKIGKAKIILHRPIPDGFQIKTATITHKPDGWYVSLSLEDAIPTVSPNVKVENTVGIDVGLKDFLVTSVGESVSIPQYARKSEKRRKLLNKAFTRKKKGSNRWKKALKRLSISHQKIANQRKYFHFKTVNWLLDKYDLVGYEKLSIAGLAKTRLSKSILDAGWGQFISILSNKAERAGLLTIEVDASGTTQNCSTCGEKVPKKLKDRWHSCPCCGLDLSRDHNAAINIKHRAEGHPVLKAYRVSVSSHGRSFGATAIAGVGKKPTLSR
jgi:putative transposase